MTIQPYGGAFQPAPRHTDQRVGNTVEVVFAWLFAVLTLGYMLPWAIAATRGKSNSLAVALVDFFAGWTLIGWIAALVMACTAHQPLHAPTNVMVQANAFAAVAPGWYPDSQVPGGSVERYWDGQGWTAHTHDPYGATPSSTQTPGYPTTGYTE
jgi:hypothetical protein